MSIRETGKTLLPILAVSIAGAMLVLIATHRYGAGVTLDFAAYVASARSLLAGRGYLSFDGAPFVMWPPLYPTVLALVGLAGFDPAEAAPYLNAVIFGLLIFVSGVWLTRNVKYKPFVYLCLLSIALSAPLLQVSVFALSEPLFALLVMLFIVEAESYLKDGKAAQFYLLSALAALACLTRYIGVSVVLTGGLLMLLRRDKAVLRRVLDAALFGIISILPLALWVFRNSRMASSLSGERGASAASLPESLSYAVDTASSWFVPGAVPPPVRAGLFLFLIGVLLLRLKKQKGQAWLKDAPVPVFLLFFVGTLVALSAAVGFDRIDDRLMSPCFAPLMCLVFYGIDQAAEMKRPVIRPVLAVLICLWLLYPLVRAGSTVSDYLEYGPGKFSRRLWSRSGLIDYMKITPLHGQVVSNAPDALYIFAGISAKMSPKKYLYNSSDRPSGNPAKSIRAPGASGDTYLVWFEGIGGNGLYDITELGSILKIEPVRKFPDGTIYLVK